ncbi:thioredoxin-like 1-1, chloroplastic [Heracleum sosnowskyi]|uniref:Thioredoxin-like 1-1, chloroplastic n=1 Tax=Heracleum sosnowskyi TaxID=360622 RepID=A0AAD8N1J6_9APIA|nr:thioredoxin-like 1-1, chloroplastic [Heracleum sosnowskyi]
MADILSKTNVFSNNFHCQNHKLRTWASVSGENNSARVSFKPLLGRSSSTSSFSNFYGPRVVTGWPNARKAAAAACNSQMGIGLKKAQGWWEKGLKTNMKDVQGPNDLVESLLDAGDQLVVVAFFSPGCGGCRALHPKVCQLAEMNPDVQFLQVNYEEHKSMCYSLGVHVLPFFRFYRGAHGRLCSFSCTNATMKKFKDALAKHGPDRCSLGPTKGLEEKEVVALAANKDLSFTYKPKTEQPLDVAGQEKKLTAPVSAASDINSFPPLPLKSETAPNSIKDTDNKTLITSGR